MFLSRTQHCADFFPALAVDDLEEPAVRDEHGEDGVANHGHRAAFLLAAGGPDAQYAADKCNRIADKRADLTAELSDQNADQHNRHGDQTQIRHLFVFLDFLLCLLNFRLCRCLRGRLALRRALLSVFSLGFRFCHVYISLFYSFVGSITPPLRSGATSVLPLHRCRGPPPLSGEAKLGSPERGAVTE